MTKEITLPEVQSRLQRVETVIKEREALPSKILEGVGPYTINGTKVAEGTAIETDIQIGEKREATINQIAIFTESTLKPRLEALQSEEKSLLAERAVAYNDEVAIRREQLRQIRQYAARGVLSQETLARREKEFKALDEQRERDTNLKRGLALTGSVSENQSNPPDIFPSVKQNKLQQEKLSVSSHPLSEESAYHPKTVDSIISLPNGDTVTLTGEVTIKGVQILLAPDSLKDGITVKELAEKIWGVTNQETERRTHALLSKIRKLDLGGMKLSSVKSPDHKGRYFLQDTKSKKELKENPGEITPVQQAPEVTPDSTPAVKQEKRAVVPKNIVEIPYEPGEDEVRTPEESAVFSSVVQTLSAHTRIWPNRLENEVNDALQRDRRSQLTYSTSESVLTPFNSAFKKMELASKSRLLIQQWTEKDLLLWETVQGTRDVLRTIAKLPSDHPTRKTWENLRGTTIPEQDYRMGLMVRMHAQKSEDFLHRIETIVKESYGERAIQRRRLW